MSAATEWIKKELEMLWNDLDTAGYNSLAPDGKLSMEMEGLIDRIREASAIVGPVDWGDVSLMMIYRGNYKAYCEMIGLPYTYPTDSEFKEMVEPYVHEDDL